MKIACKLSQNGLNSLGIIPSFISTHPPTSPMAQAKSGDTVTVHYTGKLNDGQVFDSSKSRAPLEFILGSGMVIPGFDAAVTGLSPGESVTKTIPVDEAYGPYRPEMVADIEKDKIPANFELEVGQRLEMQVPNGEAMSVTITDIKGDTITLDGNHPLAGQDLTFELELVGIKSSDEEE